MSSKKSKGCLVASALWCAILAVLAVAYKLLVHPFFSEKLAEDTGSASQYQSEVRIAADSFSGYAVLRSDRIKNLLKREGIKLTILDDQADYAKRLESLKEGAIDLAVFTIDSYLAAGAKAGHFPGSIVLIIDETQGSDAILAKTNLVSSLQSLDDPNARIVLTPNSPSEFLARVVLAHFSLPNLPEDWQIPADNAQEVLRQARAYRGLEKRAFVLWEPYVSRAVNRHGYQILLDSSKLKGYIVDVLVARRNFLRDHPQQITAVVKAYLRAAYHFHQQPDGMRQLVQKDAAQSGGDRLDDDQAQKVVQGIQWKNTLENFAHFGLDGATEQQHIEDIIINIVDVLVKTKAIERDPLEGKHHTLFYRQILAELKDEGFHPAKNINLISDLGAELEETVRITAEVPALSEAQWAQLRPVGELKIRPIVFVRGSNKISLTSKRDLSETAKKLKTFPEFYLRVIGQTRAEGDAEANRRLAEQRAQAVAQYLAEAGIGGQRLRTEAMPSQNQTGAAQSVRFIVGQLPY